MHAEEPPRKVVERLPAARRLAQPRIDVQPEEQAFGVIVAAALPARPALHRAIRDDRLIRRVLQVAPRPPGAGGIEQRRGVRQCVTRVLRRPQPRARREHHAPELRHPLVHPQQARVHRHLVARRPQVRRPAELAVPRMLEFVRQQVAPGRRAVPVAEVAESDGVLARLVMLEPDPAQVVADRQQEIVVREMPRAEQRDFLLHQLAVRRQLRVRRLQLRGPVGKHVEPHRRLGIGVEVVALEVSPRVQRRIDQRIERHRRKCDHVARATGAIERARKLPAGGQPDRRFERDPSRVVARRVQQRLFPVQPEQVGRHHASPLFGHGRGDELECKLELRHACGHLHVEGVHHFRIALPFEPLTARHRGDRQAREQFNRPRRRVIAGQPFRIQQHQRTRRHRHRLLDAEHAVIEIGRVHLEPHHTRIRRVERWRYRIRGRADRRPHQGCGQGRSKSAKTHRVPPSRTQSHTSSACSSFARIAASQPIAPARYASTEPCEASSASNAACR